MSPDDEAAGVSTDDEFVPGADEDLTVDSEFSPEGPGDEDFFGIDDDQIAERPVVAVVGRPNVGKSTLVNRIIGSRLAVVEDTPGVTRDRVAYDADWRGRQFTLVDTGGWEPSEEKTGSLAARIAGQARIAARTADAVLFVVDATVGATDADDAVADVLRRSGVPVVLAANKVDNSATELTASALWSLGLGQPYPVSALHGRASGDLLDAVLEALPEPPPEPRTRPSGPRRVALIGRPNVGKSSLLNKLAGEERVLVDAEAGTTRDPVDELIELGGKTWRFVDTAGIRRRFRESQGADYYAALRTAGALEVAEVAVVLVDASQPLTEQDLRIISMVIEVGRALVIAFNKWDMVDEERQHYLGREIDRQLYNARWAPRVNISATTGRQPQQLADQPDRGDPTAGARRAPAEGPVRHAGRGPPTARRALHHGIPGGGLPPVRGAEAARGVRLRGQPAEGVDAVAGKARPRLLPGP
jgi:GTP-binding protein